MRIQGPEPGWAITGDLTPDDSKGWPAKKTCRPNKNRIGWIGNKSNKRIDPNMADFFRKINERICTPIWNVRVVSYHCSTFCEILFIYRQTTVDSLLLVAVGQPPDSIGIVCSNESNFLAKPTIPYRMCMFQWQMSKVNPQTVIAARTIFIVT